MKFRTLAIATAALMTVAGQASAKNLICVWDVAGKSGDIYNAAIDYGLAMQKAAGVEIDLKSYVDERVAVEDFRAGQCDAVIATSFRIKPFNSVSASMDSIGSATIVRNNKIDMPASYDVVRKVIGLFASPGRRQLRSGWHFPLGRGLPHRA